MWLVLIVILSTLSTAAWSLPGSLSCRNPESWKPGAFVTNVASMGTPEMSAVTSNQCTFVNLPSEATPCTSVAVKVDSRRAGFFGAAGYKLAVSAGDISGTNGGKCANKVSGDSHSWTLNAPRSGTVSVYALCGQAGAAVYPISATIKISGNSTACSLSPPRFSYSMGVALGIVAYTINVW